MKNLAEKDSWNETKELKNQLKEVLTRERRSNVYISKNESHNGLKHIEYV